MQNFKEPNQESRIEQILLQQSADIKTIKKCALFFTILTIVALSLGILGVLPIVLDELDLF